MIQRLFRCWEWTRIAIVSVLVTTLYFSWASLPALAANADVSNNSGSIPRLEAGGTAWTTFSSAQGSPSPTKGGLRIEYTDFGISGDIIVAGPGTEVRLRPGISSMERMCSEYVPDPLQPTPESLVNSANEGQCFFRVDPMDGTVMNIYYIGRFDESAIRYVINGLSSSFGDSIDDFDSNTEVSGVFPVPSENRPPARLVLVLDKSGSMAWSSRPSDPGCSDRIPVDVDDMVCGPPRSEVLSRAVDAMLGIADAYKLPGISVDDGDAIAIAPFDSIVDPSGTVSLRPLDNAAIAAVESLFPLPSNGATSIAAGLLEFEADVMPVTSGTRNQIVLLFSDGDQNTPPFVRPTATDNDIRINPTANSDLGTLLPYAADTDVNTEDVKVCPFALRADDPSGSLGTTFTQAIAERRCTGFNLSAISVDPSQPELIQYFIEILNAALIGDKLELAQVNSGQLVAGGPEEIVETFTTSKDDVAFTVLLTWAERFNGLQNLVLARDGVEIPVFNTSAALIDQSETHVAVTLRAPFCDDRGKCIDPDSASEWKLLIQPFFERPDTFSYNLFVDVDNASIASEFRATQAVAGVGESLALTATLFEGDDPLKGLPDGSVTAIVGRPDASLGTLLSLADIDPNDIQQDNDPISAAGRKVSAMLASSKFRKEILGALEAQDFDTVILSETKPGVYSANYNPKVEGVYPIQFLVDAKTTENGHFTRTSSQTRYVSVVPDPISTEINVTALSNCPRQFPGGCSSVVIKPMDRFGNLLGPGKADLFNLPKDFEGELLEPVVDNLDGTYTIKIGYPSGAVKLEAIEILGTKVALDAPSIATQPADHQYSAKFLCGVKKDSQEQGLTDGYYGTTINVHNPNRETVTFSKELALAIPPGRQEPGDVIPIATDKLPPRQALAVDCDDVRERVFGGEFPSSYIDGFVVIDSPQSLDVTGVYTTASLRRRNDLSIDVEPVPERLF